MPSNGDALRILFFNIHEVGLSISYSRLVINEVLIFWDKARIPTKNPHDFVKKLVKLHADHRNLKRNEKRNDPTYLRNRQNFVGNLDDSVNVVHSDALVQSKVNYVKNEEDRQFLV